MKAVFVLAVFCTLSFAGVRRPRYKYSIDPQNAESVLAGLAGRVPMEDSRWNELIGEKKTETHKVRRGDNLWRLSQRLFGDAFLWRKLWEVNSPALTNPHELTVGEILRYYNADRKPSSVQEIRIPLVKLIPPDPSKGADIDNDSVINVVFKNRFFPTTFILTGDDEVFGEITGSHGPREYFDLHDPIYVTDDSGKLKVGSKYGIVRYERKLEDKSAAEVVTIGSVVRLVGELKIVELGEVLAKAELTAAYAFVQRGDKLITAPTPTDLSIFMDPPDELQARIVTGEDPAQKYFAQGNLVLVNKGASDGMRPGFVFRVWRDRDPITSRTLDVEPESKGEVRIVHVSPLSSVGMVTKSVEAFEPGDWLVPRQVFSNPPPFPAVEPLTLEMD